MDSTGVNFTALLGEYSLEIVLLVVGSLLIPLYIYQWKRKKERADKAKDTARDNRISACRSVWPLLGYLYEKESGQTILLSRGTAEMTKYYVHLTRAMDFVAAVAEARNDDKHNVFFPSDVDEQLSAIRNKVYKFVEGVLREDAKKAEVDVDKYFTQEGGFFEMVKKRPEPMVPQKNPTWREDFRNKVNALEDSLKLNMKEE